MSFPYSPDIEDYLEQKQMADEERLEREHDEAYEQKPTLDEPPAPPTHWR